jgi:hypothetical protein
MPVVNVPDIEKWLRDVALSPDSADLLVATLLKPLQKEDSVLTLVERPDKGAPIMRFERPDDEGIVYHQVSHVADWIEAAVLSNEGWLGRHDPSVLDENGIPKRLSSIGRLHQAIAKADKAMLRNSRKGSVELYGTDEQLHFALRDDWTVVRLMTPAALDAESSSMQHCIGMGSYDAALKNHGTLYLSLRDPYGKAHVTIEIVDGFMRQFRGKQNRAPTKRYRDILKEFLVRGRFVDNGRSASTSIIQDAEGNVHPLDELPENVRIAGDLNLDNFALVSLPDGMKVDGSLSLRKMFWHHILPEKEKGHLPDGLQVGGNLDLTESMVKTLGRNTLVSGDLILRNTKIPAWPKGVSVDGNIDLSRTPITSLPKRFVTWGDLVLDFCPIDELPEGLAVAGSLSIKRTRIKALPTNFTVGGSLDLSRSQVTRLPGRLTVHGDLDLTETSFLTLPYKLVVEGDLRIANSRIHMLPPDLVVKGTLDLRESLVKALPRNFHVHGNLTVRDSMFERLPEGIRIDGGLDIRGTQIRALPSDCHIGGRILHSSGILEKVLGIKSLQAA